MSTSVFEIPAYLVTDKVSIVQYMWQVHNHISKLLCPERPQLKNYAIHNTTYRGIGPEIIRGARAIPKFLNLLCI